MLVYETSRARSNRARDAQRCSRNSADRNSRFERESRGFESYRERCDLDHLEVHRCEYRIYMKYFAVLCAMIVLVGCGAEPSEEGSDLSQSSAQGQTPTTGQSYGDKNYDSCSTVQSRKFHTVEDGTQITIPELCNPYWRDHGDPVERQNPADDLIRMPEVLAKSKLRLVK